MIAANSARQGSKCRQAGGLRGNRSLNKVGYAEFENFATAEFAEYVRILPKYAPFCCLGNARQLHFYGNNPRKLFLSTYAPSNAPAIARRIGSKALLGGHKHSVVADRNREPRIRIVVPHNPAAAVRGRSTS
jgi:hypothetical protein